MPADSRISASRRRLPSAAVAARNDSFWLAPRLLHRVLRNCARRRPILRSHVFASLMDSRYPGADRFSLLDELPAPVALLIVVLAVAAPLVVALLLA